MEVDSVFYTDRSGRVTSNPLLDQLPSYQSLLYRRKSSSSGSKRRGSSRGRIGSSGSGKWAVNTATRHEDNQRTEQRAVRELPKCMEDKRREKEQRLVEARKLSSWSQWRQSTRRYLKRLRQDTQEWMSSLKLWRGDIHAIEGTFGTGILSYFSFLRFLVLLNFIIFLLMFSFVILPIIIIPHTSANKTYKQDDGSVCSQYPSSSRRGLVIFHEHITDLLSGGGFLEQTYLFYGFYKVDEINFPNFKYNVPLAYLLVTVAYLILSLIWIVKRSATGFKQNLVQDVDRFQSFCNKIFSGWDFCITNENAARLKRSSLLYELRIKLYTKQGSLKYQTDCAPINGYFMIPLYDKGDFVLKIEPPLGWSFEPTAVDLHIDGVNDICTKEQDINFVFTGFSVSGTVLSKGHLLGPAGVEVTLSRSGTGEKSVVTQPGGKYTFFKVLPGRYDITASHPSWTLEQSATSVHVSNANAPAAAPLLVGGYDVSGEVRSDGEPMKEVTFLLYSATVKKEDISACNTSPVVGAESGDSSLVYLCSALSKEDGSFTFPSLASGEYTVVPFYRGERITFDVAPSRLNFKVEHNSLKLEPIFRVMGFSVTGRVLNSVAGEGVPDATVSLNAQIKVVSKEDGSFRLENMTAGTYTIRVNKDLMYFEPITVKIAPNTPQLPDIITAGFSVCGQIQISRLPEGMKQQGRYKVTLTQQGQDRSSRTVDSDPQGGFCFQAKSGDYVVHVSLPEAEVKAGLALQPQALEVSLVDRPLTDLLFTQFMASVSGKVYCLASCDDLAVTLQPVSRQGERRSVPLSGSSEVLSFSFDNILPGKYKVGIAQEEWCWKHKSVEVEVLDSDVIGVEFRQIGYILRCSLSHAITLEFFQDGTKPENVGVYNLSKGVNRFCLSKPGVYKVTPRSCHQFEQDFYTYDTSAPSILTLTAVRHHMTGLITTDKLMDVTVTIKSSIESEPALVLGPLRSLEEQRQEQQLQEIQLRRQERERRAAEEEGGAKDDSPPIQERADELTGPFHYEFSYWARAGEKITVTPSSKELLFYPPEVEATITGESCPGRLVDISGRAGLFLEGKVSPELQGVEISITERGAALPLITVATNEMGVYSVGPLHSGRQYDITASKEGFVLSPVEGTQGDFKAFALAGVTFKIQSEDGVPLSGVLLSLSGGQFRSNLLTQDTGFLTFNNLSPGQYYFKPMMKEFRFEPTSQMITVEEGQNLSIDIVGIKTAYSCYGAVQSLSGDAERDVAVEAVGQGDCSLYSEDTVTDEEGRFRLRGLLPGCKYLIQLRAEGNDHIERALPQHRAIEVGSNDIEGVNIIAFRQINQFDLSGNIITSPEHLGTLSVKLYKSDNLDNPINSVSLGQSLFFHFPPLDRDGENYVLMLYSTLSRSQYDFTLPQVSFTSTGYHKHITLPFNPTRKVPDQDVAQGSYIALPLTLLLLLAAYNHERVIPLLLQLVSRVQGVRSMAQTSGDIAAVDEAKRQAKRAKSRRT